MPPFALRRLGSSLLVAGTILLAGGCTPDEGGSTIDRDTFVAAWADLRLAEMAASGGELPTTRRDSILSAHGVEAADLVEFAEVHGDDPAFMSAIWDDVVTRMDPDTTSGPTPATN